MIGTILVGVGSFIAGAACESGSKRGVKTMKDDELTDLQRAMLSGTSHIIRKPQPLVQGPPVMLNFEDMRPGTREEWANPQRLSRFGMLLPNDVPNIIVSLSDPSAMESLYLTGFSIAGESQLYGVGGRVSCHVPLRAFVEMMRSGMLALPPCSVGCTVTLSLERVDLAQPPSKLSVQIILVPLVVS